MRQDRVTPLVGVRGSWYSASGMYCEIVVKHKKVIKAEDLKAAIGEGRLGENIDVDDAHALSAIYRNDTTVKSLFAFEVTSNCFVIARRVNFQQSTFHVEGKSSLVSVATLFGAVQQYTESLLEALRKPPAKRGQRGRFLGATLFEDNGRETSVEGKLGTLASAFRAKFRLAELKSSLIAFATAWALIHFSFKGEALKAAGVSLLIAVVFTLSETLFAYYRGRGKIEWKFTQV